MKMTMQACRAVISLAALLGCASTVQAQFAGSALTNLINHTTNNWAGVYYIGTNAYSDVLVVTNAGRLADSSGYLGYNLGDSNNAAVVSGAGSVWTNSSDLEVGNSGTGNTLTIANSGKVFNATGNIGNAAGGNNNAVLVTDAGSVWFNSGNLDVGFFGVGNTLTVANGAKVLAASYGQLGINPGTSNNSVTVTGAGSAWSNNWDLFVGWYGAGNTLIITNGGTVYNRLGYLGYNLGAINNAVIVTGSNSVWTNSSSLYVGLSGTGSVLQVANGGKVFNADGHVGANYGNNAVVVTGANSVWSNSSSLTLGVTSSGNSLTLANSGTVNDTFGYTGLSNNGVLVTDSGSVWNNSTNLYVGYQGANSTLAIANGGTVNDYFGYEGYSVGANGTAVTVTGPGSVWSNRSSLFVGYAGMSNTLLIANSGTVMNADAFIGSNATASANAVLVSDAGSMWTNRNNLYVGYYGAGNTLTVTNGGKVCNSIGYIGFNSNAANNSVTVTGVGSIWSNRLNVSIGDSGAGNTLIVSNGGLVSAYNGNGYIGNNAGASNNSVLVTGAGSLWTNNFIPLYIGNNAAFNSLTIANGGMVYISSSSSATIGNGASASNNAVTVTGPGSLWNISQNLSVGFSGSSNLLTISNGGMVIDGTGLIGVTASAGNNSVVVTGPGSVWSNRTDIYLGDTAGFGGTMTFAAGAKVYNALGIIGFIGGATNNAVLVTGAGTVWNNSSTLYVGDQSAGNTLLISNAATVFNTTGYIGFQSGNNAVTVTGAGSVWTNSTELDIGYAGPSNSLTIASGGTVAAPAVIVGGVVAFSSNNTVAVHGGNLIATTATNGVLDIRQGAVTMDSGTMQVQAVWLTNGLAGTLGLTGGTLMANVLTNNGGANVTLSGCTLEPLNANASWSAALMLLGGVTLNTLDGNGQPRNVNFSGALSGGGTLNVTGTGTLFLNGSVTGGGSITVFPGAKLGGTGSAESVLIQSNGTLGVGATLGTFAATNLTLNGGAHLQEGLNATSGVAGVDWDLISVSGAVTLSGLSSNLPLTVDVVNLGGLDGSHKPPAALSWTFLTATGGLSGFDPHGFTVTTTGLPGWSNGLWSVTQTNNSLLLQYLPLPRVSGLANPSNAGTVTGGGVYAPGTQVQLAAVASNNWLFTGWNDGATNNPYTITVPATDITYTANFASVATITVGVNTNAGGRVTGGGLFPVGGNALLTATASTGWLFVQWSDGVTNNPRTVVVGVGGASYTADFAPAVVLTVLASPANGGTVTGGGTYVVGSNAVLTATPTNLWRFTSWNDGATNNPYIIIVPATNRTFTATFLPPVTVSCFASPTAGGSVNGGGSHLPGSNITLTAVANTGWSFLSWNDGVMSNPRGIVVPPAGGTFTANFGSTAGLGAALECTNLSWTLGGVSAWFVETGTKHGTASAAQSGAVGAGQVSYLQITTNGPASLMFWWKVSAAPTNGLQFYVGTQLVNQISGSVDWNQYALFLGTSNQVTLTWVYTKNTGAVIGSDAGWVDQVSWLPCPYAEHVPQIFYQDPTGMLASWVLNATGGMQFARILSNTGGWALKAAGDIDGDGVSDLLFETAAGDIGGWFMNADGSVRGARSWLPVVGWELKACGDFEGTGSAQLFFQAANGDAAYWRLGTNGTVLSSVSLGNMGGWKLRGLGDLDGDHKAELFWQTAAGAVAVWYHNPDGSIRSVLAYNTGGWALCGVTDIDADGVSDLLWQDSTGNTAGWFMNSNGTARTASAWWNTGGWKLKAAGR